MSNQFPSAAFVASHSCSLTVTMNIKPQKQLKKIKTAITKKSPNVNKTENNRRLRLDGRTLRTWSGLSIVASMRRSIAPATLPQQWNFLQVLYYCCSSGSFFKYPQFNQHNFLWMNFFLPPFLLLLLLPLSNGFNITSKVNLICSLEVQHNMYVCRCMQQGSWLTIHLSDLLCVIFIMLRCGNSLIIWSYDRMCCICVYCGCDYC